MLGLYCWTFNKESFVSEQAEKQRKRKQTARRRASEQALIQAALDIAEEKGVVAATFSAIGERAGYSRGLASQHFGSKAGLIEAVIENLHAEMEKIAASISEDASLSGLEALDAYVASYFSSVQMSNTSRAYFTFLAGSIAERSDLLSLFAASHERVKEGIAALIERGKDDSTIREESDPEAGALILGSLLMGVSMQSLIDPKFDLRDMERQARAMVAARFAKGSPD